MATTRVTVWNEYTDEADNESAAEHYPDGLHETIASALEDRGFDTRTAILEEAEHGLTEEVLEATDVLTWWGHMDHDAVDDAVVDRVQEHVLDGMGLIVLHSGQGAKIFQRLMGTGTGIKWRVEGERERLWVIEPGHPIAAGIDDCIELEATEMYGERFDIPQPDELVFISWFEGGEVFRSGCCYYRGEGRIFFFRPGHETFPIYHDEEIQQVLANGVEWASPTEDAGSSKVGNIEAREDLS